MRCVPTDASVDCSWTDTDIIYVVRMEPGAKLQVITKLGSRRQGPKRLEKVQGHVDQSGAEGD
jgi:hypothetical protein